MKSSTNLLGAFSGYLDFVRLFSALSVVVYHCGTDFGWPIGQMGIDAVAVFFVLSGLVISIVTESRETSPAEYASARLARLYSVLAPALVLTFILDRVGMATDAAPYVAQGTWFNLTSSPWDYLASLLFINQIWWTYVVPGSDLPIWSLTFEAWCYLIFGVLFFCKRSTGFIAAIGLLLVAGPKLIVLAPCWFLGVASAKIVARDFPRWLAWAAAILPIIVFMLFLVFDFPIGRSLAVKFIGPEVMELLRNAAYFPRFWFVSILASIHFVGMSSLLRGIEKGLPGKLIANAAQFTYSIYLFHFPIKMVLLSIVGPSRPYTILALSVALPVCLGLIFEPTRVPLRRYILAILSSPSPVVQKT